MGAPRPGTWGTPLGLHGAYSVQPAAPGAAQRYLLLLLLLRLPLSRQAALGDGGPRRDVLGDGHQLLALEVHGLPVPGDRLRGAPDELQGGQPACGDREALRRSREGSRAAERSAVPARAPHSPRRHGAGPLSAAIFAADARSLVGRRGVGCAHAPGCCKAPPLPVRSFRRVPSLSNRRAAACLWVAVFWAGPAARPARRIPGPPVPACSRSPFIPLPLLPLSFYLVPFPLTEATCLPQPSRASPYPHSTRTRRGGRDPARQHPPWLGRRRLCLGVSVPSQSLLTGMQGVEAAAEPGFLQVVSRCPWG